MNKILIVDGLNYLFRAYFGITDAIKAKNGQSINAVFGFFSFLRDAVKTTNANYILVIFDAENAVADKQIEFDGYKANREYADLRMFDQLVIIKEILDMMKISHIEEDKKEADDLIGAYSNYAVESSLMVYISSNDYDFMQLVKENVNVIRCSKGAQNIYDEAKVLEHFGILPKSYPDYAALTGDRSDNIKGVPGIGKIIAKKLIEEFKTIENLILNKHYLTKNLQEKLELHVSNLKLYKSVITINSNLVENYLPISKLEFKSEKLFSKTRQYLDELNL